MLLLLSLRVAAAGRSCPLQEQVCLGPWQVGGVVDTGGWAVWGNAPATAAACPCGVHSKEQQASAEAGGKARVFFFWGLRGCGFFIWQPQVAWLHLKACMAAAIRSCVLLLLDKQQVLSQMHVQTGPRSCEGHIYRSLTSCRRFLRALAHDIWVPILWFYGSVSDFEWWTRTAVDSRFDIQWVLTEQLHARDDEGSYAGVTAVWQCTCGVLVVTRTQFGAKPPHVHWCEAVRVIAAKLSAVNCCVARVFGVHLGSAFKGWLCARSSLDDAPALKCQMSHWRT